MIVRRSRRGIAKSGAAFLAGQDQARGDVPNIDEIEAAADREGHPPARGVIDHLGEPGQSGHPVVDRQSGFGRCAGRVLGEPRAAVVLVEGVHRGAVHEAKDSGRPRRAGDTADPVGVDPRRSIAVTSCPRATSAGRRSDPMKSAAPVTAALTTRCDRTRDGPLRARTARVAFAGYGDTARLRGMPSRSVGWSAPRAAESAPRAASGCVRAADASAARSRNERSIAFTKLRKSGTSS